MSDPNQTIYDAVFHILKSEELLMEAGPRVDELIDDPENPMRDMDKMRLRGHMAQLCFLAGQLAYELSELSAGHPDYLRGCYIESKEE